MVDASVFQMSDTYGIWHALPAKRKMAELVMT